MYTYFFNLFKILIRIPVKYIDSTKRMELKIIIYSKLANLIT